MNTHLTIKELPDSEKPYEKFMKYGPEVLSDAELIAVIIKSGTNGSKAIEVAQDFLNRENRNLMNLYEIGFEEMLRIRGIGKVKAIQLKCIAELSKRITQTKYFHSVSLNSAASVAAYYMERMRHEKQEILLLSMFDSKCNLIDDAIISKGSVNSSFVSPREIFLKALQKEAVYIILLHNHPSGSPIPSKQDHEVTRKIDECGKLLGIGLSDHIIIGRLLGHHQDQIRRPGGIDRGCGGLSGRKLDGQAILSMTVGATLGRPPAAFGGRSPTSVMDSVPKSRVHDSFSLQGEAFGRNFYLVVFSDSRFVTDIGFSLGRSCHPLALRNQWMTDVGSRRRRHGFCFAKAIGAQGSPYGFSTIITAVRWFSRRILPA